MSERNNERSERDNERSERNNERLLQIALEELHGGKAPPDLTAKILAAARGEALPDDARGRPFLVRQRARLLGVAAGALLALGTLALLGALLRRDAAGPLLKVTVAEGSLSHKGRHGELTLAAGETRELPLSVGDGLRSARRGKTHLDLFSLGALRLAEDTLLEVKDMKIEQNQFGGGFALGAVTVAVIGGAIWWVRGSAAVEAKGGESLEMRAGKPAVAAVSAEELARLRQIDGEHATQVASLQSKVKELEERLARQPVPASRPEPEKAVAKGAEADGPKSARFAYPGMEKALSDIDWTESGPALHKITTLLADLQEAIASEDQAKLLELAGQIQVQNGILVKNAAALVKNGVPGTGVNGSFTHPVIAANQLNAALADAKLPLDNKQADALSRLASQFAGDDDQRRAAVKPGEPALRGVLDELDLKDRFFEAAKNLMTNEQRDLLFRRGTEDTIAGTLFSSGVVWQTLIKPTNANDGADYTTQLSKDLSRTLDLDEAGQKQLATITQRWTQQLPKELLAAVPDGGMLPATMSLTRSRVRNFAAQQLALTNELLTSMSLTPEQRTKLASQPVVRLPIIRAKK